MKTVGLDVDDGRATRLNQADGHACSSLPQAITRRGLLRYSGVGAASTLLGLDVAARGDDEKPRRGGVLRLGLGGGSTTDTLNPLLVADSVMIAVIFGLYNTLVENSATNRPVPDLAEHCEAAPGAAKWIMHLRRGVPFHNGKEFDADDAIYSLNLHRGATRSGAAGPMRAVTDIRKVDKYTLEFHLAESDADFRSMLSDYHLVMVPDGFTDWTRPIGTGAFTIEEFQPGVRIQLRGTGEYWKAGRGYLDGVDIQVINDVSLRMTALVLGQVDAVNRADPRTAWRLERNPALEIVRAPGGWFPIMAMQVDKSPYTNPDLRRALKHVIDREQVIRTLFGGYGVLGNDQPIPPSDPSCNTDLPQTPYDPEQAKFYFRKAGLDDPQIVLQTSDGAFNGAVDMARMLQSNAAGCGIPVSVAKEQADGYFDKIWLNGPFVTSYWAGRPSATQMLDVAFRRGAPWNETHWDSDRFEELLAAAKAETDEPRRKAMIWDMQALLHGGGGALIPCFRDWLDAHHRRVGGHTPHSGFDMDNGRIAEKAFLRV